MRSFLAINASGTAKSNKMPEFTIGDDTPFQTDNKKKSKIVRLKNKGDRIHFQLCSEDAFITYKHTDITPEGTKFVPCPRMDKTGECEYCNKKDEIFQEWNDDLSEEGKRILKEKAKKFFVKKSVFYKILDVNETGAEKAKVLQVTDGVAKQINDYKKNSEAESLLGLTFFLVRNKQNVTDEGKDFYSFSVTPNPKPLDFGQEMELEAAKQWKWSDIIK